MREHGPSSWTDQLFKSGLTLLLTMVVLYITWELASRLLGPLIVILVLLAIIRMAFGFRWRRW